MLRRQGGSEIRQGQRLLRDGTSCVVLQDWRSLLQEWQPAVLRQQQGSCLTNVS